MSKKIVILFDLLEAPPPDQNYRDYEKDSVWDNEVSVKRALQRLGHEVVLIGVFNDITRLITELNEIKPDLIFNMVESFNNNRNLEPQVVGVFELLGIPFTGTRSLGLGICKDKALSKKILSHHRIRIPRWVVSHRSRPLRKIHDIKFPAFVKASHTEGSEGISKESFVESESDAIARAAFLHEKYESNVIIEEFIEGRELYMSVLGDKRLQCFPMREIVFQNFPEDEPKFATYKSKWDEKYRKKWGIRNEFARNLEKDVIKRAENMCKKAFAVLHLHAYARFDLRLNEQGELYMLEANPNPSITDYDDFAASGRKADIEYDELIAKLIDLAY
ncbi:MAG: hypothetical protein COV44_03790 [Deltaproteobacteria bacterium CG11_big_fil_rev_8_21_14_0_20_45_16]|nr:MAG: hypothetical protein COV44_03790 [Deltaproteobacteria bacterium CG11_big_fil_rev_8_21_14_0_20_45_16]